MGKNLVLVSVAKDVTRLSSGFSSRGMEQRLTAALQLLLNT